MSKIRICKASDVPAAGMKCYDTAEGRKVLILNSGESFHAYQGLCPHQDVCLDEGFFDGSTLTCHQHLWQWDVKTGEPLGLAEAPLERSEVAQEDGQLEVDEHCQTTVPGLYAAGDVAAGLNQINVAAGHAAIAATAIHNAL